MGKKSLLEQLINNNIESISYCNNCEAYSVTIEGTQYSVHKDNFFKFFPTIDQEDFKANIKKVLTNTFSCCDWCVNHWGLDLCACGSGEPYESCNEHSKETCGKAMQVLNEFNHVRGHNSWI